MEKEKLEKLLERYLDGSASPTERTFVDNWLKDEDSNRREDVKPALPETGDRMWSSINARLHSTERQPLIRRLGWLRTVAAALLVVVGGGAITTYWLSTRNAEIVAPADSPLQTMQTPLGRKAKITLADGTTIWLNGGTTIRYPKYDDEHERKVYLDYGEAFFDVAHDANRPFVVATAAVQHRVLGTSFNISLPSHRQEQILSVLTGKVQVTHDDGQVTQVDTVVAGYQFVLSADRKEASIATSTFDRSLWKDNILVLRNATWAELADELAQWYDVRLLIPEQPLKHHRFTASFDNASLERVLESLQKINSFTYRIVGKEVIINP